MNEDTSPYQLLPALTADEYAALKADIADRGVQVPVEYDEQGHILDGHHRVRACQELGIKDWPRIVRVGLSEEQKRTHVRALNLMRRHLTHEQRDEQMRAMRAEGATYGQIANAAGVSYGTAHSATKDVQPVNIKIDNERGQARPASYAPRSQADAGQARGPLRMASYAPGSERDDAPVDEGGAWRGLTLAEESVDLGAKPHVAYNSGDSEWYTPQSYIEAARVRCPACVREDHR